MWLKDEEKPEGVIRLTESHKWTLSYLELLSEPCKCHSSIHFSEKKKKKGN